MVDICALSTVHYAYDSRIYHKQARSLAAAGFRVTVVARAETDAPPDDTVEIRPVASHRFRLTRFLGALLMIGRALRVRARIYVIHDPELLPLGLTLKLLGRRVVYDMHEDMPAQIGMKEWLPRWSRPWIARVYRRLERWSLGVLDGLVLAESGYEPAYSHRHRTTVLNYPAIESLPDGGSAPPPEPVVTYVGTLTERRGLFTMLEVARQIKEAIPSVRFKLVGPINVSGEADKARRFVEDHDLGQIIQFTGRLAPVQAHAHLKDARVGLALLEPEPNYLHSLPTKLFEYMLAGVPVLCSHVPLWRQIVEEAACGYAVDPHDISTIVDTLQQLLTDDEVWQRCRAGGLHAVHDRYSWSSQIPPLVEFYTALIGDPEPSTKA